MTSDAGGSSVPGVRRVSADLLGVANGERIASPPNVRSGQTGPKDLLATRGYVPKLVPDPPVYDREQGGLQQFGDYTSQWYGPVQFLNDAIMAGGSPWIDILAFGADPTASTDSTAAIQSAVTSASQRPGAAVYIPPGNYLVTSTVVSPGITVPAGVNIIGSGTLVANPIGGQYFYLTLGNDCRVIGLTFNGNSASFTGSGNVNQGFVRMLSASNVAIYDCTFQNIVGTGVQINASSIICVRDCQFINGFNGAIVTTGPASSNIFISNNYIANFCSKNVGANGVVAVNQSTETIISNNQIVNFPFIGIAMGNGAAAGGTGARGLVTGNVVDGSGNNAAGCIDTGTWGDLTVSNNMLICANTGGGIVTAPPNQNCVIIGNRVLNAGNNGISMGGLTAGVPARMLISGNMVSGSGQAGIQVEFNMGGVISGNYCFNNGQNASAAVQHRVGILLFESSQSATSQLVISGNYCGDDQTTPTQQSGIYFFTNGGTNVFTNILVSANVCVGNVTSAIGSSDSFASFDGGSYITGNVGYGSTQIVSGPTANRPVVAGALVGTLYFDTTLGNVVVWNGTAWVNA